MKHSITLLSGALLLAGCFESSTTSASNTNPPNETSSSSFGNPTSSFASADLAMIIPVFWDRGQLQHVQELLEKRKSIVHKTPMTI